MVRTTDRISVGDRVSWNTFRGRTEGRVTERREQDFMLANQLFRASSDDPVYIVKSDQSGDKAAHHARSLRHLPRQRSG